MTIRAPFGVKGDGLHTLMNFLVAFPSFISMGYSQSFFGGVVGYESVYTMFPQVDTTTTKGAAKSHNALIQGVIVATLNLGAVAGCLSCMYIGNRLGRKRTTLLGAAIGISGTVIHCTAFSTAQLVISRAVLGVGVGILPSTVPAWQSEMSKTHSRGRHVIVDGICIALGIALGAWVNFGFSHADTTQSWAWRVPCIGSGIPLLLVLATAGIFPESPRWLVLKNRIDEARETFAIIEDIEPDDERVNLDIDAVARVNDMLSEGSSFLSLFRYGKDKTVWRVILAVSCQFFTQMNGAGLITYYSKQLFETIGISTDIAGVLSGTSLLFKFICCFIAFVTIEMAGRKRLFLISMSGMSMCMFCLAICGSQVSDSNKAASYAGIVFAFVFVFFLPIAFLGVNFLYCQEIISTRFRAPVAGISTAMHWLSAAAVALTTPLGFATLSWKYYLIWGCASASFVPFMYFLYPETTGLSMEEIDQIFISASGPLDAVAKAKVAPRHATDAIATISAVDGKVTSERVEHI